jgi:hypothetical protein
MPKLHFADKKGKFPIHARIRRKGFCARFVLLLCVRRLEANILCGAPKKDGPRRHKARQLSHHQQHRSHPPVGAKFKAARCSRHFNCSRIIVASLGEPIVTPAARQIISAARRASNFCSLINTSRRRIALINQRSVRKSHGEILN